MYCFECVYVCACVRVCLCLFMFACLFKLIFVSSLLINIFFKWRHFILVLRWVWASFKCYNYAHFQSDSPRHQTPHSRCHESVKFSSLYHPHQPPSKLQDTERTTHCYISVRSKVDCLCGLCEWCRVADLANSGHDVHLTVQHAQHSLNLTGKTAALKWNPSWFFFWTEHAQQVHVTRGCNHALCHINTTAVISL